MGQQKIENEIKKVIAEVVVVDEIKICDRALLIEDLGFDSLDLIELVMALEDLFEIPISDDQAESVKTFADVVDVVYEMVTGVKLERKENA